MARNLIPVYLAPCSATIVRSQRGGRHDYKIFRKQISRTSQKHSRINMPRFRALMLRFILKNSALPILDFEIGLGKCVQCCTVKLSGGGLASSLTPLVVTNCYHTKGRAHSDHGDTSMPGDLSLTRWGLFPKCDLLTTHPPPYTDGRALRG